MLYPTSDYTQYTCRVLFGVWLQAQIDKNSEVQSIVQEAFFLAMIDHPNVIKHKETFVSKGQLMVVVEYCKFGDLQVLNGD